MALPSRASRALDRLARAVFGGRDGAARFAHLAARFAAEVAREPWDEAGSQRARWLTARLDWALCDAAIPGGRGRGDTWAARAARGEGPGDPEDGALACATWITVLEVVGRRPPVAVCRHTGAVGPVRGVWWPPPDPDGATSTWGARLWLDGTGLVVCREPWPVGPDLVAPPDPDLGPPALRAAVDPAPILRAAFPPPRRRRRR